MAATARGRSFPDGFSWGTATAAHQIEGANTNNDWWAFEHTPGSGCAESSGDACDSYARWEEDADLVAGLGLDNYRFSVEWSRIEPADGEISRAALEHYRRQCIGLRERGVDPVVTFHHFTTPLWLTAQGGWETGVAVERFGRFCTVVAEALGDVMTRACTLNEPNIVATMGWHAGMFPPGKTDNELSRAVGGHLIDAHRLAVEAIRAAAPGVPVGLTLAMTDYQPTAGGEERLESIRHHAEDATRLRLRASGGRAQPRRGLRGRGYSQPTGPSQDPRAGCAPPAARPPVRRASTPSTPGAHVPPGMPRAGASTPRRSRQRSPTE